MSALFDTLSLSWPWYAGGPLIGLLAGLLLLLTGKGFGVSSSFRHFLASALAGAWTFGHLKPRLPHG